MLHKASEFCVMLDNTKTSLYSEGVKFFKPTLFKLLFAILLPLYYLPSAFLDHLNITCPGGPCGYHLTPDLQDVIHMMRVAMERNAVDPQTLFVLWFSGFILGYFVFSIAEALYGMLRKPKKTLLK